MATNLNEMIMGVTASEEGSDQHIRLKYLAITGGCGPELFLDRDLALKTIAALQAALDGRQFDSERDYKEVTP